MTTFTKAIYHAASKTAEFIHEDGRHLLRAGGSLPWRINNAGNLVSPLLNGEPAPKKTKGFIGFAKAGESQHHFFIFPDYETGRAQLKASLQRKYADKSLKETIHIYAPSHDNNDTDRYVNDLSKLSGVSESTKIGDITPQQLDSVMDGIERIEGYHAKADTRVEKWVTVSHIQATDGTRPIAGEEIVVKSGGKETTLKSNAAGQFAPIVHGKGSTEVHHKTVDGKLKPLASLSEDQGKTWNLVTRFAAYIGITAPVAPTAKAITKKQPLIYVVTPGDSLSAIAAKFQTTAAIIKQENGLKRDMIFPGQQLRIHGGSTSGTTAKAGATRPSSKAAPKKTTAARSQVGAGKPIALIRVDQSLAPWMAVAFKEATTFAGQDEKVITKTHNYHRLVTDSDRAGGRQVPVKGKNGKVLLDKNGKPVTKTVFNGLFDSLVGNDRPWCASFVNYCIKEAGYAPGRRFMSSYTFSEDKDLFVRIKEPIYGAIRFSSRDGGGHVCFVYGVAAGKLVIVGGNQKDQVCFQLRGIAEKGSAFFAPIAYKEFAESDAGKALPQVDVAALRKEFGAAVLISDAQLRAVDFEKQKDS